MLNLIFTVISLLTLEMHLIAITTTTTTITTFTTVSRPLPQNAAFESSFENIMGKGENGEKLVFSFFSTIIFPIPSKKLAPFDPY